MTYFPAGIEFSAHDILRCFKRVYIFLDATISTLSELHNYNCYNFFLPYMLIGLTGTPGTGKTSVSKFLERKRQWKIIHLNDLIKEDHLYTETDEKRNAVIADMELIQKRLKNEIESTPAEKNKEPVILESHLAHYIADIVIVLRTHPAELKMRLEMRGYGEEKIRENIEAEALDVILVEAFEWCKKIFEVNTTGKSVEEVGNDIEKIIDHILNGDYEELSEFKPGTIDWIDLIP
jgi:adenylate kinase